MRHIGFTALVALCMACGLAAGCSTHKPKFRGSVELRPTGNSVTVDYDLHIKAEHIDSIAIQLLPERDYRLVTHETETRIRDSLYWSLSSDADCCFDFGLFWWDMISRAPDSVAENFRDMNYCWWCEFFDEALTMEPTPFCPRIGLNQSPWFIDSVLEVTSLDSLRRVSVPCTWQDCEPDSAHQPPPYQSDLVVYRADDASGGEVAADGQLTLPLNSTVLPEAYCVKAYGEAERELAPPLDVIWAGVVPPRPMTRLYRFEEEGKGLGMAGGIGLQSFDRSGLPSQEGISNNVSIHFGILYYTPSTQYQVFGEVDGLDSSGTNPSIGSFTPLGVRHYPFTRSTDGLSMYGGLEGTFMRARKEGQSYDVNDFGAELGLGYDTDFDRLTYSYHTGQEGFHEVELLVGFQALQQAKVGVKLKCLYGDVIRVSTLQLYMENRLDYETMERHNRRPFLLQAALYAGMAAAWATVN